jgi:hypothetical protein
MERQLKEKDQ